MKRDLWLRLRAYHFDNLVPPHLADHVIAAFGGDDASTRAFANKLARKLGWSAPFARRAIEEYRKFVFLGVSSDFTVTPPRVIDQVWHEHLLFSRAYREFCREVLRRDFDHSPELVATDDQIELYEAQYNATLALYHLEFYVTPPVAFWGTPKFSRDPNRKPTERLRERSHADGGGSVDDGTPLFLQFDGHGGAPVHSDMPEFHQGGGFSGGGGGAEWQDSTSASSAGDAAGEAGGSSCSSSCDGGGCGGD